MAKFVGKKRIDFKLFGRFRLFSIQFTQVEHSRRDDYEEDDFYIELEDRIIEQDDDDDDQ